MRLITGATAGVGRAADEELVAEDQLLVRAPRPTGRFRGPPRRPGVRRGAGDRLVLRVGRVVGVAGVDEANVSHPPAPDEIASAAGQREEMIALDDVRAETDGAWRQCIAEVARREVAHAPLVQGLIPDTGVGNVAELDLALLGNEALGFDEEGQAAAVGHVFEVPGEQPLGELVPERQLGYGIVEAWMVRAPGGEGAPALARVAAQAEHQGPGEAIHLNEPGPLVAPLKDGGPHSSPGAT